MNVNSPEFIENPYPFYDARRSQNPAFKRDSTTWTLTGYEVLSKVLAHSSIGRGNVGQKPQQGSSTSEIDTIRSENLVLQIIDQWMLFQNPPKHSKSRKRIADVFTVKMIQHLESLMRRIVRRQITAIKNNITEGHPFDLIEQLAYPYPAEVICEMIGIPPEDQSKFQDWTRDFSLSVQLDFLSIGSQLRTELNETAKQVKDYFDLIIQQKKEHGGDDLINLLIEQSNDSISHMDLLSNCIFLLFAGQETTTLMISNAVHALLSHPEQLKLLKSKPELVENAVEECLRFDTSTQMIGRYALDDVKISDLDIKKGDHIFAFIGAAGRDPEANSDPHKFDITREKIKHLAFARGAHHCLGASLARLELRVFLEEFLFSFEYLSLAGPGQRRLTWLMRGFESLPIRYQSKPNLNQEKVTITLGNDLHPFQINDLDNFSFQDYRLENVFENINQNQQQACVDMWMQHQVIASEELAWRRSEQICYIFTHAKSGKVIGVNTLYESKLAHSNEHYFFNRMYITPEHRNTRLMITGTAAMLCYAKYFLSDRGIPGIINVNENQKLSRSGMQRIFSRLGYQHYGWQNDKEVIFFEFDRVNYV